MAAKDNNVSSLAKISNGEREPSDGLRRGESLRRLEEDREARLEGTFVLSREKLFEVLGFGFFEDFEEVAGVGEALPLSDSCSPLRSIAVETREGGEETSS